VPEPRVPVHQDDIAVVVVTYGDRLACVQATLEAALGQTHVTRLVIVDNGSAPRVGAWLDALAARAPRLTIVRHAVNLGSAGGYRAGLVAARATRTRFVWLLDDDTRPEPGAAQALVEAWAARSVSRRPEVSGLLSQRWPAARYRRENGWRRDAAFGVDLIERSRRLLGGGRGGFDDGEILLGMAPWSGLFFERGLLDEVGLPDERLVTYEDDHEFTLRMTRAGARILLVPQSGLANLEPSWHEELVVGHAASPWLTTADTGRVYYGARNRVHVERRCLVGNPLRHLVNLVAFVVLTTARARTPSAWHNARWFLAGIVDGWRGRLGSRTVPRAWTPSGR
jgi:GT2 family glycosyltransferase